MTNTNTPVVQLAAEDGTTAAIAPQVGFNCFRFKPMLGDGPVETLWTDPRFLDGDTRPAASGIPVLFPFPGRIPGGKFEYQSRTFSLPEGDGRGNAIHGFVLDRPWEVTAKTGESITGRFRASEHLPNWSELWPADFEIETTYTIAPRRLDCRIRVSNPCEDLLPFGLGTHPYFRVPFGDNSTTSAGGVNEACIITVPAGEYWELRELLPTGEKLACDKARNLASGKPFPETDLDDVLTSLTKMPSLTKVPSPTGDQVVTSIFDRAAGRALKFSFDAAFGECVVYNPPHRQAICIEPYTCVPGIIGGDILQARDRAEKYGIAYLPPGQSREYAMTMEME